MRGGGQMERLSKLRGAEVYSDLPHISLTGDDNDSAERNSDGDGSGIKWRYATQGSQLHEASSRYRRNDAAFARQSYVDGVVYLLKGLPDDMDDLELAAVRQAAADATTTTANANTTTAYHQGLLSDNHDYPNQQLVYHPRQTSRYGYGHSNDDSGSSSSPKPLLHRTVQRLVAALVLLAHLLFCLAREGMRLGARCERRYHVSRIVAERGLAAAGAVGRYMGAVRASPAGHAAAALGARALDAVVAGLQDGLGEGVGMLLVQRQREQQREKQGGPQEGYRQQRRQW
ncbi:hypothetical protein SLS62_007663 [Diatrype stigma]|uniref:Uncharacterized protein n=1 Tax=Diatrype stigma TaxID=117547 RepID=A0AAN9YQG6_9PEZI